MMENGAAPRWAAEYLGIPFRDRGLTRAGCDCWGLYRMIVLERAGVALPEYPDIPAGASLEKLETILAAAGGADWNQVAVGAERPLDCVLMKGLIVHGGAKHVAEIHIGCVVAPGTLIHIERGCEVTLADYRNHPRVKRRVVGFFRHVGMPS